MRWGLKGNPKVEWLVVESWQGGKVTTKLERANAEFLPEKARSVDKFDEVKMAASCSAGCISVYS